MAVRRQVRRGSDLSLKCLPMYPSFTIKALDITLLPFLIGKYIFSNSAEIHDHDRLQNV